MPNVTPVVCGANAVSLSPRMHSGEGTVTLTGVPSVSRSSFFIWRDSTERYGLSANTIIRQKTIKLPNYNYIKHNNKNTFMLDEFEKTEVD